MKNVLKRSMSIMLALLVVLSALPVATYATDGNSTSSALTDISTKATNALGEVLSEPFNSSGGEVGYSIGKIDFADMIASVTLYAPDNSTVLVSVYDESDNRMVTSGKASVNSSTEEVTVKLAECELPEYFVIKGYIVDENNRPVSDVYENIEFTQRMEEFHEKTVDDFHPEYVINLDTAIDNNFAVVDYAASTFAATSTENTVVTDDFENGKYVISNASDELKAVAVGDVVFIRTGDGPEDFILTKVGKVSVSGSTVTINAADSAEPDELFQFVKFDTSKIGGTRTLSDTDVEEGNEKIVIPATLSYQISNRKEEDDRTIVKKKCADYDISVNVIGKIVLDFKCYRDKSADISYCEYSKTTDVSVTANVEVSGTFGVTFQGKVHTPVFACFEVFAQVSLDIELKGKVSTEMKVSYTGTEGFVKEISVKRGIYRETATSEKPEHKIEFSQDVEVMVNVKLTVKAGISFLKVLKAYLVGSAEFKMSNELLDLEISNSGVGSSFPFIPWSAIDIPKVTEHPCTACVKIALDLEFRVGLVLEASLNGYDYDEKLEDDDKKEKSVFDFGIKAEPLMVCKPIHLGDFRASFCNGKFEFELLKGEKVCPHQTFLMAFLVVDPKSDNAPVANTTIEIKADEATFVDKESPFYNPYAPASITVTTDSNGFAKVDLPKGVYIYEFKSDDFVTLPDTKSSDTFVVNSSTKEFKLNVGKSQKVTINVVSTTGSPVKGADVNGVLTDAKGKVVLQLVKGTHNIVTKYREETATAIVNVAHEPVEKTVHLDLGYKVTCILSIDGGTSVQGYDIDGVKTDEKGEAILWKQNGEYTINVNTPVGSKTEKFVVDNSDLTIRITFPTYMEWSVTDGHLVISGVGPITSEPWEREYNYQSINKVTINAGITGINNRTFSGYKSLTSVSLPNSVTYIGSYAFSGCENLTSITIPDSVTEIYAQAFSACSSLTTITIPDSVTYMESEVFRECRKLKSVVLSKNLQSLSACIFLNCESLASVVIPYGITNIYMGALGGCKNIEEITIPSSVINIADIAFAGCEKLRSVVIPDSVIKIGTGAFQNCTGLSSIILPDSVASMGAEAFKNTAYFNDNSNWIDGALYLGNHLIETETSLGGNYAIRPGTKTVADKAFWGCEKLSSITIPFSTVYVGAFSFKNCYNLEKVYWNAKNVADFTESTGIFDYAARTDSGLEIVFGNSVEKIPAYLCYISSIYRVNLKSVTIPEGVTSIGSYAFNCTNITSVKIPDSVTYIGGSAFYSCKNLKSITIPENVTYIGSGAFQKCSGLEIINWNAKSINDYTSDAKIFWEVGTSGSGVNLVFGDAVEKIPSYLCSYSKNNYKPNIKSVTIGNRVTSIGTEAFESLGITEVVIPESVTNIEYHAFYDCYNLEKVYWNAKNVDDFTDGNLAFTKVGRSGSGIDFVFGEAVESVPAYLLYSLSTDKPNIKSITLGENVKRIGAYAFFGCSNITSITIPENVTSIGEKALYGCFKIESVNWNAKNCENKTSISHPVIFGSNVEKFPINVIDIGFEKGCTNIPEGALKNSVLNNVYIPVSIKKIGKAAFYNCKNLQNVYYEGTQEQWNKIDVGHSNTILGGKVKFNSTMLGTTLAVEEAQLSLSGFVPASVDSVEYTIDNQSVKIKNAKNGTTYMLYVVKSDTAKDLLSADNLLYASQKTSAGNTLEIPFKLRENYKDFKVIVTEAVVTTPDCKENGHIFTSVRMNFAPTCTEKGSNFVVCRLCGYTEYSTVEPLGHNTVTIPGSKATCTKAGHSSYVACENCDMLTTEPTVIPAGHSYGKWVIITQATETTDGLKKRTCSACGNEENQVIHAASVLKVGIPRDLKINAKAISYAVFTAPQSLSYSFTSNSGTYDAKGYLYDSEMQLLASNDDGLKDVNFEIVYTLEAGKTYYLGIEAVDCNSTISVVVKKACNHKNIKSYSAVAATCTTDGYTSGEFCNDCDEWIKGHNKIPATGHKVVKDPAVNATCTKAGKTEGSHCSVCKAVIKARKTVAKKGHTASAWITTKKATVNAAGSKYQKCTVCGVKLKTAKIAQLKCAAPKLKSVVNVATGINFTWNKVTGADNYEIYRKTGNGAWKKLATVKGTVTTYTDKTAKSGTTYKYTVKAKNEAGLSSYNTTGLTIKCLADPVLKAPTSTKKGITLKWNKVTGAQGYVVYRKAGNGKLTKLVTVKGISKISYTDKSAKKGTKYTYQIKAYSGKTYSAYSNAKTIKDKY